MHDVVLEFAPIAEGRNIVFRPQTAAESSQIVGDISLIQRMIDNLVDNAVQHTPPGGTITVTVSTDGGHFVLEVRDTGRGIECADLKRIFNRYERVDRERMT